MEESIMERVSRMYGNMLTYTPSNQEIRERYKYYKCTIKEGFWGKSITWEERDVPLTDKELEKKIPLT